MKADSNRLKVKSTKVIGENHSITYVDSDWLSLRTLSVIIKGASICALPGINSIEQLVRLYDLNGITNGRLLILECFDSIKNLKAILDDVIIPEGLCDNSDFVVYWNDKIPTWEQYEELGCEYRSELESNFWLEVNNAVIKHRDKDALSLNRGSFRSY